MVASLGRPTLTRLILIADIRRPHPRVRRGRGPPGRLILSPSLRRRWQRRRPAMAPLVRRFLPCRTRPGPVCLSASSKITLLEVTVDPARDMPARLKVYSAANHGT